MSATDCDQSISLVDVKSCRGTFAQVTDGLCCVAFNVPNKQRANFVLTYLRQAVASSNDAKFPTVRNVSV